MSLVRPERGRNATDNQHSLEITAHGFGQSQDGNRIQGSHKGDFSVRDVFGTIEGNKVKLRSQASAPGDSITFIFDGTLAGDALSGPVFMGEYLNAKFTAKRHAYPSGQGAEIRIPKGPPLAN